MTTTTKTMTTTRHALADLRYYENHGLQKTTCSNNNNNDDKNNNYYNRSTWTVVHQGSL